MNTLLLPVIFTVALMGCAADPIRVLEYEGTASNTAEEGPDLIGLDLGNVEADIHGCRVDMGEQGLPPEVTITYSGTRCDVRIGDGLR